MATRQQPSAMMRAVSKVVPPSFPLFFLGRASAVEPATLARSNCSAPQPRERRRRHQLGFLLEQIPGFGILFEIRLPFRIGHHRRAPAAAIGRILVDPDMDVAVDVSGLGDQPRQRLAEMPLLGGKTMLFIERYLLAQATCANGVSAVIEQHVTLVGLERFFSKSTMPALRFKSCGRAGLRIATAARPIFQSPAADDATYCNRTTTLSIAPRPSITVSRTKPGPSGSKNSARLPREAGTGSPLTSTVSGPAPPVTLSAIGSALPELSLASSSRAPLGGNIMRSWGSVLSPARAPGRKRCRGGGSLAVAATSAPFGDRGSAAGNLPVRAEASNRIGAAAALPIRPGTGAPSGRPTHTPMVCRPSNPTAQASR